MITKEDFDKATKKDWSSFTCLIAQKVIRETESKAIVEGPTYIQMITDTGRWYMLSKADQKLQMFFDGAFAPHQGAPLTDEEKESNLFFLRAFLPLEDKDL